GEREARVMHAVERIEFPAWSRDRSILPRGSVAEREARSDEPTIAAAACDERPAARRAAEGRYSSRRELADPNLEPGVAGARLHAPAMLLPPNHTPCRPPVSRT